MDQASEIGSSRSLSAASARDRTPSFARIAETWWSTVRVRQEQAACNLAVRHAGRQQAEDLNLSPGEQRLVSLRRGPRAARQVANATVLQTSSHDRRGCSAAQPLQFREGLPQRAGIVGIGECERGLVGTVQLPPEFSRELPIALRLRCERRWQHSRARASRVVQPRPQPPGHEAGRDPGLHVAPLQGRAPVRWRSQPPACRPRATPASARASAGSSHRCSSPVGSARCHASSRSDRHSGSPRRARTRPMIACAIGTMTGEVRGS